MVSRKSTRSLGDLVREARTAMIGAGVYPVDHRLPGEVPIGKLRRRRMQRDDDEASMCVTLLRDENDVLRWETDAGPSAFVPSRRRAGQRRRAGATPSEIIDQFKYRPLAGSKVGKMLDDLDNGFNKLRGLRALTANGWGPVGAVPVQTGRILLIVHGTFSSSAAIHEGLSDTKLGRDFLREAVGKNGYTQVLAFEHPTLSVSPFLNGFDLARVFADTAAEIDVICHSRGGLVVRWWLEALNVNPQIKEARVVFVGSPLGGTSLASPERLRQALNLLTNVIDLTRDVAGIASLAVPMIGVIGGLMRLVGSATRVVASTPVIDGAVAMIPGLAAQARMENNFERMRLGMATREIPKTYSVIRSNFEPDPAGWKFWKYFVKPVERAADAAVDWVFDDANDLVVDTISMSELSTQLAITEVACICDFGTNPAVHHLNYFSQTRTVEFLANRLAR